MSRLVHPGKDLIEAMRKAIVGADRRVAEGVKWNAPSFRTSEYFATTNLREKVGVGLILHLGAKARDVGPDGMAVGDPKKLLKWLAADRAMIVFKDQQDFLAKQVAFQSVIRHWLAHV
jgi:hypothetical protein